MRPIFWTDVKLKELEYYMKQGATTKFLMNHFGKTRPSIECAVDRVKKMNYTYDLDHHNDKNIINSDFFNHLKPKTILSPLTDIDRYWQKTYGSQCHVIENTPDRNIGVSTHMEIIDCLTLCKSLGQHFDIVDLDTFGDCSRFIEFGIEMADKGLIINECAISRLRRFHNRKNHVRNKLNINVDTDKARISDIINYVKSLALSKYNKKLIVFKAMEWDNCCRIWFEIVN